MSKKTNEDWTTTSVTSQTNVGETYARNVLAPMMFVVPEHAVACNPRAVSQVVHGQMRRLVNVGLFEQVSPTSWKRIQ